MLYQQPKFTLPAAPEKITACERCVYDRGLHAEWCPQAPPVVWYSLTELFPEKENPQEDEK